MNNIKVSSDIINSVYNQLTFVLKKLETELKGNKIKNVSEYTSIASQYMDMYVKLMSIPVRNIDAKLRLENDKMKQAIEECIETNDELKSIFNKYQIYRV